MTVACAICWGAWPTPKTGEKKRWRTTGNRSSSIPGFRGDPVLLAHVDAMLADPKKADAALDLVIDRVGAPAADLLEKVANDGSDLGHRQRAADALEELGQGKRVDRVL